MLEIFGTNPIAREHAGGAAGILEQLRVKGHDVSDLDVGKVKFYSVPEIETLHIIAGAAAASGILLIKEM